MAQDAGRFSDGCFRIFHVFQTMGMKDKIFDVMVPKEKKIKIRNGKRYTVEERIFPG